MSQGRVGMAADVAVLAMTADLGAEIRGIDLAAPLSDACCDRILDVFHRYCMVFLRAQALDPRLLLRLAARFGDAEIAPAGEQLIPGLPQVSVLRNANTAAHAGGAMGHGASWRTDNASCSHAPSVTLVYVVEHPSDAGSIEFVNLYSVFDALPRARQVALEALRVVREESNRASAHPSPSRLPADRDEQTRPCGQPLVRVHPVTQRRLLHLDKESGAQIVGRGADESRKLMEALESFATQPRFVYAHHWRKGDLIVWDNRCTLHRIRSAAGGHDRILHRIQVKAHSPTPASSAGVAMFKRAQQQ